MNELPPMTNLETIKNILTGYLKNYLESCHKWNAVLDESTQAINIYVQKNADDKGGDYPILKMQVIPENEEVYITLMMMPPEDRGRGIGMGMVKILFDLCQMMRFSLVLFDMTEGLYDKMLARGAKQTNLYDALEVTEYTNLGEFRIP